MEEQNKTNEDQCTPSKLHTSTMNMIGPMVSRKHKNKMPNKL